MSKLPPCPNCKSTYSSATQLTGSVIIWLVCKDCGHVWCAPPTNLEAV